MKPEELIALLVTQVEVVWSSVLRGDTPPRMQTMYELMRAPVKIGDLVVMNFAPRNMPPADRIGWIESVEDEPYGEDGERGYTRYWTIRRLTEGTVRWTNVLPLRVIKERRDDQLVPVTRDESSTGSGSDSEGTR